MHEEQKCAIKLMALIDAVERIDKYNKDTLPYRVDNAKELARELKNESKFITKVQ
jgi:hypothetical protein|tara:strand:- start:3261 stop:3425 length:165 start_codon:yes stop_codon:yes gene_type:complete